MEDFRSLAIVTGAVAVAVAVAVAAAVAIKGADGTVASEAIDTITFSSTVAGSGTAFFFELRLELICSQATRG